MAVKKQTSDIAGKVCVVTGAAGLLGHNFMEAIAAAGGAAIGIEVNRRLSRTVEQKLKEQFSGQAIACYQADITDVSAVRRVLQSVKRRFGKIDALVNSAYPRNHHYGRKFEAVTYRSFCDNVSQHLGGYFLMAQAAARLMKRQQSGTIINLGSIYGFAAPRFELYAGTSLTVPVEYAAIKGGIINLTRYLASYLGRNGIRVNCISPGGVWNQQPARFVRRYTAKVLLGKRMAQSDDVTGALLWLISDAARYVTGQNIVVDGGWSL